jgi:hypothetical protein
MVVSDLLLFYFSFVGAFGVLEEAVEEVCGFFWFDVVFDYDSYVNCPSGGNGCVIYVVEVVRIAETVLSQYDVLVLLAKHADKDTPTANRNINTTQTTTKTLTNTGIKPINPNKIADIHTSDLSDNLLHTVSSKENEHQAANIKSDEIYQFTNSTRSAS